MEIKDYHGKRFIATICGVTVEGKVSTYNDSIYLCQDSCNGAWCPDTLGYRFSWGLDEKACDPMVEDLTIFLDEDSYLNRNIMFSRDQMIEFTAWLLNKVVPDNKCSTPEEIEIWLASRK